MPTTGLVPQPFLAAANQHTTIVCPRRKYATYHRSCMFFQLLHEECNRLESLIANQSNRRSSSAMANIASVTHDVTNFSGSTSVNDMLGITLEASSSISKQSMVAMKPINPATRA